jgi:hypothetical protein
VHDVRIYFCSSHSIWAFQRHMLLLRSNEPNLENIYSNDVCDDVWQAHCHRSRLTTAKSSSSSAQYVAQQKKIGWRKVKHASLAQQNSFGPEFFQGMLRLVKGTAKPSTHYWLAR